MFSLTLTADSLDDLKAKAAEFAGAAEETTPPKKKAAAEEPKEEPAPAKKKTPPADEVEEIDEADDVDTKRDKVRGQLRKLAELSDRATAKKILAPFGESVDDVEEDDLLKLSTKLLKQIKALG